jgi:acyl carrier protein
MTNRQQILEGVSVCLIEALDIEENVISEESTIVGDLGADSLDLLDLIFRLEQQFGIKISPREIERRTREKLGSTEVEIDGVYTPEMLVELHRAMPEVPAKELHGGLRSAELPRLFRVATMVNLVSNLLDEQGD